MNSADGPPPMSAKRQIGGCPGGLTASIIAGRSSTCFSGAIRPTKRTSGRSVRPPLQYCAFTFLSAFFGWKSTVSIPQSHPRTIGSPWNHGCAAWLGSPSRWPLAHIVVASRMSRMREGPM